MLEHAHEVTTILAIAPLLIGALVGAGLGAAKHFVSDKPNEEADRRLAAETARYSPWTGMRPGQIKRANLIGSVMQGGGAGALVGSGIGGAATGATPEAGAVSQGPFTWGLLGRANGYNNWEDLTSNT